MDMVSVARPERTAALLERLLGVWEASVRPTHLFLGESDIEALKPCVLAGLADVPELVVVYDKGAPCGFLGVSGDAVEMLFLHPDAFGQGAGRMLLDHAVCELGAVRLDVNEGNPKARGFYEHCGFVVCGRSELDDQGRPFPILHMKKPVDSHATS